MTIALKINHLTLYPAGIYQTHSSANTLKIIHLTLCHTELVKGYFINPFMARAPGDQAFNPLPTKNISKVNPFMANALKIIHLTLWHPELV